MMHYILLMIGIVISLPNMVFGQTDAKPFVLQSIQEQTFEQTNEKQLLIFSNKPVSHPYVQFNSENQTFIIQQTGYYEIQLGLVLQFTIEKPLPNASKVQLQILVVNEEGQCLEAMPYFVARHAVKEPVFVQLPKSVFYFAAQHKLQIWVQFEKGVQFLGKGPHSTGNAYMPFSKTIQIKKI